MLLAGCGSTIRITPIPPPNGNGNGKPRAIYGFPPNGQKPRALLMMIHGGGWTGINASAFQFELHLAKLFQPFGFETVTVEYRRGAEGISDVERFYRQARARVGRKLPICALGPSAGGRIALMLAVMNSDLACAISEAGPTDLPALRSQPGGRGAYQLAATAFGTGPLLARMSPALHVASIKAKLMLVYADDDPVVPVAQGREMARVDSAAKLITLPPGPATFVHTGVGAAAAQSGVSAVAKQQASRAEIQFLFAAALRLPFRPGG